MAQIKVYELLQRRVLVTREAARSIQPNLFAIIAQNGSEVALDFSGVEGVTPSFVDEVLAIIDEYFQQTIRNPVDFVFLNPPTRLSLKFSAVGKGHGYKFTEQENGAWRIVKEAPRG